MPFCTVPDALEALRWGRMLVVVDDAGREGDLVLAAEKVTPEAINFMATMGRGLVCLAISGERAQQLALPLLGDGRGPAFTLSLDAREGITTGISAYERAYTIRRAVDPRATAADFVRPGHVFPLRARDGGVRERAGQAEAAVELARLAGLYPAGVTCAVMKEDGTMAMLPDLIGYCRRHGLKLCRIADLVEYVRRHDRPPLFRTGETALPTRFGTFRLLSYEDGLTRAVHLAVVRGEVGGTLPVLARIHPECIEGDTFGSLGCDCGVQLVAALGSIAATDAGVLVYLRRGFATDQPDYEPAAQILRELGVQRVRLLTNNPDDVAVLNELGIAVAQRVGLRTEPGPAEVPG